jgi:hypothetical protein
LKVGKQESGQTFSVLLVLSLIGVSPAAAQLNSRWFDINPASSNDGQNGGSSGRINHVGASSDLSIVFAATEWGGLYQSFDQGNVWVRVNTFSPSAVWDVKVDPNNSKKVYATSFFDGRVNSQAGISVSPDGGTTWNVVNITALNNLNCNVFEATTQPFGWQISISPENSNNVFVGTSCGLAITSNAGGSWTFVDPTQSPNGAGQVFAVNAHAHQIVDVITSSGFFRSTNNGTVWSPLLTTPSGPVAANSGPGSTIANSPAESYVLLAANANNIFESDDGGNTWPSSLTLPLLSGGSSNVQGRIPFVKTNQLSTSTQFDVWFADVNVFKTTATTPSTARPGGSPRVPKNSWSNMQNNAHWDSGDVMFDLRSKAGACPTLYTSDGGVFRNTTRDNPGCQNPNWQAPAATPHATWVWGFDGIPVSPGVHALTYGLQDNGGYAATNVAEGFSPPAPNWNNYACCDVLHNSQGASGHILSEEGSCTSGCPGGRTFPLYIRNQDGSGANAISNYPSSQALTRFESGQQAVPLSGNGYALNLPDGVYFTNDITAGTIGWTALNAPTSNTTGSGSIKVANFGGQPNVFFDTANGNPENQGEIFRSGLAASPRAPGANWIALPLPSGIVSVNTYDVDSTDGNHIIISGINGSSNLFEIWITPNFGTSWTRLTNLENLMLGTTPGAGSVYVNRADNGKTTGTFSFGTYWQPSLFKFDPKDPTTILAGAVDAGIFLSLDNGSNWTQLLSNVNPSTNIPSIPRPLFGYFSPGRFSASTTEFDIWVGSRGAGVHKVVVDNLGH